MNDEPTCHSKKQRKEGKRAEKVNKNGEEWGEKCSFSFPWFVWHGIKRRGNVIQKTLSQSWNEWMKRMNEDHTIFRFFFTSMCRYLSSFISSSSSQEKIFSGCIDPSTNLLLLLLWTQSSPSSHPVSSNDITFSMIHLRHQDSHSDQTASKDNNYTLKKKRKGHWMIRGRCPITKKLETQNGGSKKRQNNGGKRASQRKWSSVIPLSLSFPSILWWWWSNEHRKQMELFPFAVKIKGIKAVMEQARTTNTIWHQIPPLPSSSYQNMFSAIRREHYINRVVRCELYWRKRWKGWLEDNFNWLTWWEPMTDSNFLPFPGTHRHPVPCLSSNQHFPSRSFIFNQKGSKSDHIINFFAIFLERERWF